MTDIPAKLNTGLRSAARRGAMSHAFSAVCFVSAADVLHLEETNGE